MPSPILPSLKWLATAFGCLGVFVLGDMHFPMPICWSQTFLEMPLQNRLIYYFISLTFKRFFYYSPFCISTGAIVASGLGYNGAKVSEDGKKKIHKWDKIVSIFIYEIETMTSPIDGMRYWNH